MPLAASTPFFPQLSGHAACFQHVSYASAAQSCCLPSLTRLNHALPTAAQAHTPDDARTLLQELEAVLRQAARTQGGAGGGAHTACADLLALHAATRTWVTAARGYKGKQT